MKTVISYIMSFALALLVIAPPLNYEIPVMVNSFLWCYMVVVAGFLGVLFVYTSAHVAMRAISVYLLITCFFSQVPYLSLNAYILVVATLYIFLVFQVCDYRIILTVLAAVFWFECIVTVMQLLGRDKMLNFNRSDPVFLGTVMQYMRFSSVLAILAAFLVVKNKAYIIPIGVMCVLSRSSSFAMSLIAGCAVYFWLKIPSFRARTSAVLISSLFIALYAIYDFGSFDGAIDPEHGGRLYSWYVALSTWVMDTSAGSVPPFLGPFQWDWFLIGHGLDTFLPLFPVYKHDPNPFPQAHNCWIQFLWEIGSIGFGLVAFYTTSLYRRLLAQRKILLIAGMVCICTNMFFAFPTRMTQTMLLIVAFAALCEKELKRSDA